MHELVFKIGIAQVPGIPRAGQIGGVAVPVQQVERTGCFALEVIVDDIVPDQFVGPQEAKGIEQVTRRQQTALGELHFAPSHERFVNKQSQNTGVAEVHQAGQKSRAVGQLFAAGCQHGKCRGQHSAADTETQYIEFFCARDFQHLLHGGNDARFNVVVPGHMGHLGIGVAPAQDEGPMALLDGKTHHRVVWLQVQDIELVDAGRYHEKRTFVHLFGKRLVFDELENFVLENDCPFAGSHIESNFKMAFVGHRNMTFFDVG